MRIAVLANLRQDAPVSPDDPPGKWDDLDVPLTIQSISQALTAPHRIVEYFPASLNLVEDLSRFQPDICFNVAEGFYASSREAQVPSLLDMLRIPYTGSGVLGMSLSHNKHIAKRMFRCAGLPTADFFVVSHPSQIPQDHGIPYPLFVKPAHEGTSIGINESAVVWDDQALVRQVEYTWNIVHSLVLVEKFIAGREFTVSLLDEQVLPVVEIHTPTGFYSHALKEVYLDQVYRTCPAVISDELLAEIERIAHAARRVLELDDLCRMDMRMDEDGNLYILEVNPLPLLYPDPEEASFVDSGLVAGYTYPELVNAILKTALKRWGLEHLDR